MYNCVQPFVYSETPYFGFAQKDYYQDACNNLQGVMTLTNAANVPFSNEGYLQSKTDCMNGTGNPRRKDLDFADVLKTKPVWPVPAIYPTQDYTPDSYPLQPPVSDINAYDDCVVRQREHHQNFFFVQEGQTPCRSCDGRIHVRKYDETTMQ